MPDVLPLNVRELLEHHIDSFEKLEIVIALRAAVDHAMTMDELVDALNGTRELLRAIVTELTAANLVERTARGAVRLAATSPVAATALAELAGLWELERALVARTLADISIARIRRMAERSLAGKRSGGDE